MEFEGLEEKFHQILGRHKFQTLLFSSLILLVFELVYVITSWITFRPDWLPVLVTCLGLLTCSVLSIISAIYRVYQRCSTFLALMLWTLSLASITALCFVHTDTLYGYMYLLLYISFVVYTLLPLPLWLSMLLGLITCLFSLVLIYFAASEQVSINVFQVLFLTGTLACVNGLGVAYRLLQQKYISMAFRATKNCVESRIKLEHERQQQEQLLLSVMPAHLAEEMKTKMLNKLRKPRGKNGELTRRKSAYGRFQDLYIKVYDNVSILYADIVNFTPLASSCSPAELVSLLNELFGRFDKLAHSHNCTRIKFLGDCYYCVSGIPDAHPKHANNCVQMALDMLNVIKEVRSLTKSNIDMRIGIHTGVVLSGVLGLKKWQYDVWSDDVVIANCLESCGVPGMIHISRSTLNELDDSYHVVEANQRRNQVLVSKDVDTFLIQMSKSGHREKKVMERIESKVCLDTMQQLLVSPISIASFLTSCAEPKPFAETSCEERIVDTSVQQVETSLRIFKRTSLIFPHCVEVEGIHWTAISNMENEFSHWNRKDKYFTESCIVACSINAIISVIGLLVQTPGSVSIPILATMAAVFIGLGIFLFASLYFKDFKLVKIQKVKCPIKVKLKIYIRIGLFVLVLLGYFLLSCVFLSCEMSIQRENSTDNETLLEKQVQKSSDSDWRFVFCDVVFLIGISTTVLYQQLSYLVKLPLVGLLVLIHLILLFTARGRDCGVDYWLVSDSCITCTMTMIVLFMILRQSEVTWKLGLLWQQKFGVEKQEVETFGSLNKLLLENVLPFHVADHFLNTARGRSEELYHESYDKICVVFASIPNFWEYYQQSAVTKHGIECLRILNEIICDFDQLLSKPKYSSVEKIKTIGSTYMAASGVHRGRSRKKGASTTTTHSAAHCTVVIAEFAQALFEVLETLNKNSFTQFKLRIGINSGPAVAGVIGANKPQYDIWGDTVNVASRMESTGVMDKIHCTESTVDDLTLAGFTCDCRGEIKVKGKQHPMVTYLIANKHMAAAEGESR